MTYTFYRDEGELVRLDESFSAAVYSDETHGWTRFRMTAAEPLVSLTREEAQIIAGEGVDLDARVPGSEAGS